MAYLAYQFRTGRRKARSSKNGQSDQRESGEIWKGGMIRQTEGPSVHTGTMEESVKELAECSICTDLFTDPRMLPCIHTFCLKCLNEVSAKSNLKPNGSMPCPLCRTGFVIPKEGMVGLKKNFFMERLVDVTKISKHSKGRVPCDNCTEEKDEGEFEVPSAAHYCIHCQQHFCDRCCREHQKFRLFKGHQLVALGSPLREELIRKFESQFCDQHREEKAKLYCSDCKQVICIMCFAEEHRSHNCSDIEKVAGGFRESINNHMKQLRTNSDETLLRLQEITKAQTSLTSRVADVEKAIITRANELKTFVDKCAKSLLDELALITQQTSKQLENEKEDSERHQAIITSFEVYCKELTSKGSSAEICRFVEDFNSRVECIQDTHIQHVQQQLPSFQYSFEASQSIVDFGIENIVGVITSQDKSNKANFARQDCTRTAAMFQPDNFSYGNDKEALKLATFSARSNGRGPAYVGSKSNPNNITYSCNVTFDESSSQPSDPVFKWLDSSGWQLKQEQPIPSQINPKTRRSISRFLCDDDTAAERKSRPREMDG